MCLPSNKPQLTVIRDDLNPKSLTDGKAPLVANPADCNSQRTSLPHNPQIRMGSEALGAAYQGRCARMYLPSNMPQLNATRDLRPITAD